MSARNDRRLRPWFVIAALLAILPGAAAARRDSGGNGSPPVGGPFSAQQVARNGATLASLDSRELAELRTRKARFDRLPASEQQRLRELHAALMTHPRSAALQCVMHRYVEWLKTLDQELAARLSDLPADERLAGIRSARCEGQRVIVVTEPSREEMQRFFRENLTPAARADLERLPLEELELRLKRLIRLRAGGFRESGRSD